MTVDGDIDGDGKPDVTIRPESSRNKQTGFLVSSSRNRLHALTLEGFASGVLFQPSWRPCCRSAGEFPSRQTFTDNVVSDLVIRGAGDTGVTIRSFQGPGCDAFTSPCATYNRWSNTAITGNTIEVGAGFGISVSLDASIGDRVERLTITGNTIRIRGEPAIQVDEGGNSTQTRISDVLIAHNAIDGVNGQSGIVVASGLQRARANTIDGVRILDNRIRLVRKSPVACCFGIVVTAGSDVWAVDVRPVKYPDGNVVRDVQIARNFVSGALAAGVSIMAGTYAGGSRNRVENVRVERNVIRSTTSWGKGVYLWVGDIVPFEGTAATGNRITGVAIDANRIETGTSKPLPEEYGLRDAGGIVLLGGWHYGRRGVIRDVRITSNRIATARVGATSHSGIRLIGGLEPTARGNSVTCVRLAGNRITGTREAVSVESDLGGASRNRASLGGCWGPTAIRRHGASATQRPHLYGAATGVRSPMLHARRFCSHVLPRATLGSEPPWFPDVPCSDGRNDGDLTPGTNAVCRIAAGRRGRAE